MSITTALDNNGKEKKKLDFKGVTWGKAPSTFNPSCNSITIDCGRSNLLVIDVDLPAMAAWEDIEARTGGPFNTLTVKSGSGGKHLYFKACDDVQLNRTFAKEFEVDGVKLDIDVRGRGGCIIAPPSGYAMLDGTQRRYSVLKDVPVAEMPQALQDALKAMLQGGGRRSARGSARGGGTAAPQPSVASAATQSFEDLYDQLKSAREAVRIIERLATTPELLDVFNTRDVILRIAFALNNIANGTDLLLPVYTQLLRASPQAQANVEEYAAGLYRTPPPADGGPRPGLAYLRTLLPPATTVEEVMETMESITEQAHEAQQELAHITTAHRKRLSYGARDARDS